MLRLDRCSLRFWDAAVLGGFLAEAGFEVEAQFGDFQRGLITDASAVVVVVARRVG